jgi:predicted RecB family nuclease
MGRKISREVLESYVHCKTKAHLKLAGQQGIVSDYEALLLARRQEVRQQAVAKILAKHSEAEVARGIPLTVAALQSGPPFVLDATLEDDLLSLGFDGLKRVDGASKLGDFHYVPMLFHEGRKVGKEQRLLLELYGLLLSRLQGQIPPSGIIWHGKECRATRVRLNADLRKTERLLREVKEVVNAEPPPKLILNDHCQVCEFRQRCYDKAVQEDNISLLRGIGEKEIKRYGRKGISTVTQLAHTFRPRRKGKRQAQGMHKRYHALQALAIRDKRIYVFGTPQLKASPVRIYLDMEGDPDEGYVYLIGMIIVQGDSETRKLFWADGTDQEGRIFEEFLAEVSKYKDFLVFCYGGYERAFLQKMRKQPKLSVPVDRVLKALVNTLSLIYSHFYFPTHSNGLKDIGRCLGCSWTEPDASGIQSAAWRKRWEATKGEEWKQRLTTYNLEDCAALKRVTEFVYAVTIVKSAPRQAPNQVGNPPVVQVQEIDRLASDRKWGPVSFFHPDFNHINNCAYFDYQRERVYVRTSKALKKTLRKRTKSGRRNLRVTNHIRIIGTNCPACGSNEVTAEAERGEFCGKAPRVKRAYDLVMSSKGITRRVIEYQSLVYQCIECRHCFVPKQYQDLDVYHRGLKSWIIYQHVAHRLSFRTIQVMLKEFFGLLVSPSDIHTLKHLMAKDYRPTYQGLLQKILSGTLLHVDETEVKLRTGRGFVWVFTSLEEVVFMYRPTREGDFLRELLKDFNGVLVSDFYAAYDSIECPQQKCLIHLMRDINQELLNNPYDEELQSISRPFGALLRAVVETIDQHGLKSRHLIKHKGDVEGFFRRLSEQSFRSDAAVWLHDRLVKYRNKLFTFIDYDGVPWNNNNAENAIKQFAYSREETTGLMKERGLSDYLVLLSICQTCRYKGVSFLKFLNSGQRDVDSYCKTRRLRR